MNYTQIVILLLQGTLVVSLILLLFRLRKKLGLGALFACLGLFQFVQVFLSSNYYVSVGNSIVVSPGSSILFTATLFALLIIYIKEDASETKKIIYALLIVNTVMAIILQTFGWDFKETSTNTTFNASTTVFDISAWVLFVGTIVLFLDSLLIIILFEFIARKIRFLFLQICLTMFIVVCFDTIFFSIAAFWSYDNLSTIIITGIISKGFSSIFYSLIFYFYLKYFDSKEPIAKVIKIKDVFQPLTFKQKFESAVLDIKEAKEQREMELVISNKEKEKQIAKLERSKQKIQATLALLEKSELSKNEVSKVAKIGFQDYDSSTNTYVWSDYIYEILGFDPKNGVPPLHEITAVFDEASQKKIAQARLDLDLKGIPCDVELKLINKNKEEAWVRYVAQPAYNQQNEIVGRRGIMQNITESKNAQLALELSKQKIENSLKLIEKSEYSKNEASRIAKIGHWEYNIVRDTFIWSDYVYKMYGLSLNDKIPSRKEIIKLYDTASQIKLAEATLDLDLKGVPYDIELKLINYKKEEVWVRNVVQLTYSQQNEIIGRRGIIQDITTSKNAQLALELSKQKIETSLDLLEKRKYSMDEASKIAKIGYLEDDIATEKYIWSEYLYHIFGFDPKKPVPSRKEIAALFDTESQKKMMQATLDLDLKGIPFDLELKMINLRKEEVWARIVVQPVYNQHNKIVGRRGVMQNITASKNAQLALELSKQKIETSLDLVKESEYSLREAGRMAGIGYWRYEKEMDLLFWSEAIHEIYGTDPKKGTPDRNLILNSFHEESRIKLLKATEMLVTKGISFDVELQITNLKNEKLWVRNIGEPVFNNENEIIGRRGVIQNITAPKNAQVALKLSKQKIENSLELLKIRENSLNEVSSMAKIGNWEHNKITGIITWSDYVCEIFGFDPKGEMPPREEIINLYDAASLKKIEQGSLDLDTKGISYDLELKLINLRKEEIWVRNVVQPIYNQQNEIIGQRGVIQNITASKNAQLALEISKQKLQTSLNLLEKRKYSMDEASKIARIGYWDHDLLNNTLIWSDFVYQIFEVNPKDGIPKQEEIVKGFTKKSQEKLVEATQNIVSKGIPYDIELKWINERKEEIWIRNVAQPIYNQQNEIVGKRGVMQDITASKSTQQELEQSKQKIETSLGLVQESEFSLREAGRMAKIGYWRYEKETDTIFWSDVIHEIYGSNPKDGIPEIDTILRCFYEESRQKLIEATLDLAINGVSFDIELELKNLKNEKRWIRNLGEPIYNDKNEVVGRRGVSQDITEKKIRQEELDQKSKNLFVLNEALNQAQKLSHVGSWQWDMTTDSAEWSEEMYNIYGVKKGEFYPSNENVNNKILPEDMYKVEQGINSLLINNMFVPFEFRIKRPTGEIRHLYIQALDKKPEERVFGVTMDITERKQIEEKNLRITEEYKQLFDNVTTSIWNEDLTEVFEEIEELRKRNILNIEHYLEQNPEVVSLLLSKIKVNKVNDATLKLFEAKNIQEFLNNFQNTFGKGSKNVFRNFIVAIWNYEKTFTSEANYKTLKGDEFTAIVSIPIPQTKTKQKTIPLSIQNIQKIKDAELEKNKTLERLKESQKIAKVGSWMYDFATKETEWSKETYNIWGYDSEKPVPNWDIVEKRIHKKDQEFFTKASNAVFNESKSYDIEFRICLPNNIQKTIRSICKPIFDEKGTMILLKGVDQDITKQKQIEDKNLRITEEYKELFNNVTISIWNEDFTETYDEIERLRKLKIPNIKIYLEQNAEVVLNLFSTIKVNSVNKATLKLFEAKSKEYFLNNFLNTFTAETYKVFANFIVAIWNHEKTFTSEVIYKKLNGEEFTGLISIPIPQTRTKQKSVPLSIQSIQSIKDAELKNKESLNKLKEAQKLAKIGSWYYVLSSEEIVCSDETFRVFGLDPNKGFPKVDEFMACVHEDDKALLLKSISQDKPYDIEYRVSLPNGDEKYVRTICEPILGENGEVVRLKGSSQDITEQKKARIKIEKAEEMYRLLTDYSYDLISLQEPDSTFKYISPSIRNLLGYEPSDFLGKQVFSIVHKKDVKPLKAAMKKRIFDGKFSEAYSFRVRHKKGYYVWLEFLSSPVYKGKEISYYVTSARDITQWVLAKDEIQEYQTSLQKLTTEITLIEEKQKKEIASNIHDHLSQSLVISKMRINELKKNPQLKVIDEDLKFIESHIAEALENSRKITYELSPPILYQLGIIDALNWLLEDVEATHKIKYQLNSNVDAIELSEIKAILLYRSIQEVIKNTIKYAKASLITLDIHKNKLGFQIYISDNGVGFDTAVLKNHHHHSGSGFGLFTVQERIQNIQGNFTITSEINIGTTVKILIPLTK